MKPLVAFDYFLDAKFFPNLQGQKDEKTHLSPEGWWIKPGDLTVAEDKKLSVLRVLDYFLMWCIRMAGLELNSMYTFFLSLLLFLWPMW